MGKQDSLSPTAVHNYASLLKSPATGSTGDKRQPFYLGGLGQP